VNLVDYLGPFLVALRKQLEDDQKRQRDTWKKRPVEGQVGRIMNRFRDYENQNKDAGTPFPWLKVAGNALIGWVRVMKYPGYTGANAPHLVGYLQGFDGALLEQLRDDQKRWGETWKTYPADGQVKRIMDRFRVYEQEFEEGRDIQFPWLKVTGYALIGWVRENYPDYARR